MKKRLLQLRLRLRDFGWIVAFVVCCVRTIRLRETLELEMELLLKGRRERATMEKRERMETR